MSSTTDKKKEAATAVPKTALELLEEDDEFEVPYSTQVLSSRSYSTIKFCVWVYVVFSLKRNLRIPRGRMS